MEDSFSDLSARDFWNLPVNRQSSITGLDSQGFHIPFFNPGPDLDAGRCDIIPRGGYLATSYNAVVPITIGNKMANLCLPVAIALRCQPFDLIPIPTYQVPNDKVQEEAVRRLTIHTEEISWMMPTSRWTSFEFNSLPYSNHTFCFVHLGDTIYRCSSGEDQGSRDEVIRALYAPQADISFDCGEP